MTTVAHSAGRCVVDAMSDGARGNETSGTEHDCLKGLEGSAQQHCCWVPSSAPTLGLLLRDAQHGILLK